METLGRQHVNAAFCSLSPSPQCPIRAASFVSLPSLCDFDDRHSVVECGMLRCSLYSLFPPNPHGIAKSKAPELQPKIPTRIIAMPLPQKQSDKLIAPADSMVSVVC